MPRAFHLVVRTEKLCRAGWSLIARAWSRPNTRFATVERRRRERLEATLSAPWIFF